MAARLQELEALEEQRRYRDTLHLALELAGEYPKMENWTSKVNKIARKMHRRELSAYLQEYKYLPWEIHNVLAARLQELEAPWDKLELGTWLLSTLTWLPFFIPTLALGVGILPHTKNTASSTVYLWLSLGLVIVWGLIGFPGENVSDAVTTIVACVGAVAGTIVTVVVIAFVGAGDVVFILLFSVAVIAALGVTCGVAGVVEGDAWDAVMDSVRIGMAFVIAVVVALVVALYIADETVGIVADGFASSVTSGVVNVVAGLVMTVTASVLVFVMAFGIANTVLLGIMNVLAEVVAFVAEENMKKDRPSWLARMTFGVLLLPHVFLIWFSFLGGWRVFQ